MSNNVDLQGAKLVLLDVLLDWCSDPATDLPSIGAAFNLISHEYRMFLDVQVRINYDKARNQSKYIDDFYVLPTTLRRVMIFCLIPS